MANNRLFIADDNNKELLFLGKSYGSGWEVWIDSDEIEEFLRGRDMECAITGLGFTSLRLVTEGTGYPGGYKIWRRGEQKPKVPWWRFWR